MVKIDKYISDLLHDNECVIVPKMGGFISSHSREGIQSWQSQSTKLTFNAFLDYNDGLLANQLVEHEKITYDEALFEIERFVDEFQHEINAGKKFVIERVGTLYKDAERNVQIDPFENRGRLESIDTIESIETIDSAIEEVLQEESIQTETLAASPVEQEQEIAIKQAAQFGSQAPLTSLASISSLASPDIPYTPTKFPRQKFIAFRKGIIAGSLILTASILGYCIYFYFSTPSDLAPEFQALPEISLSEQPIEKNQSESVVQVPSSDPVPESVDEISTENKYFIVAGSFKSLDNAKRKLEELKHQGFFNAQIFSDNRHLQLVCYSGFTNLADADVSLNNIKKQHQEAWIYSR